MTYNVCCGTLSLKPSPVTTTYLDLEWRYVAVFVLFHRRFDARYLWSSRAFCTTGACIVYSRLKWLQIQKSYKNRLRLAWVTAKYTVWRRLICPTLYINYSRQISSNIPF